MLILSAWDMLPNSKKSSGFESILVPLFNLIEDALPLDHKIFRWSDDTEPFFYIGGFLNVLLYYFSFYLNDLLLPLDE